MKKRVTMCDPPSGWKYGFPKPMPSNVEPGKDFYAWLILEGYPDEDINLAKYCRFWTQEIEVEDESSE